MPILKKFFFNRWCVVPLLMEENFGKTLNAYRETVERNLKIALICKAFIKTKQILFSLALSSSPKPEISAKVGLSSAKLSTA